MANSASLISSAFSIPKPCLNNGHQHSPSAFSISRSVVTSLRRNPSNFTRSIGMVARCDITVTKSDVVGPWPAMHFWPISLFTKFFYGRLPPPTTMVVHQKEGINFNEVYESAEIYLSTIIRKKAKRYKLFLDERGYPTAVSMVENDVLVDTYKNIQLAWQWRVVLDNREDGFPRVRRSFELSCDSEHGATMMNEYLPYVLGKANEIKAKDWCPKFYTKYGDEDWMHDKLYDPRTFDNLAMEPELKRGIVHDLDAYLRAKEKCEQIGIFRKRRYLLYGPDGAGKWTLIEVMANYLKYDIYNLELANITSYSELRRSLLSTTTESIIVINDIDSSALMLNGDSKPKSSRTKSTFSGLLNMMDELGQRWEHGRIIIFRMNLDEKIDPALLGRVDEHIHMSYCSPAIFDQLAHTYLGISDHPRLFPEIKGLLEGLQITPGDIGKRIIGSINPEMALARVVNFLQLKRRQSKYI